MAAASYLNTAQQRVLRTLATLIDRGSGGALPSEIADTIGTIASNTTRDLANLRQAGFARSVDGRWYSAFPASPARGARIERQRNGVRNL
jgi:hypothetical protein